jgi:hypothetical protein
MKNYMNVTTLGTQSIMLVELEINYLLERETTLEQFK